MYQVRNVIPAAGGISMKIRVDSRLDGWVVLSVMAIDPYAPDDEPHAWVETLQLDRRSARRLCACLTEEIVASFGERLTDELTMAAAHDPLIVREWGRLCRSRGIPFRFRAGADHPDAWARQSPAEMELQADWI